MLLVGFCVVGMPRLSRDVDVPFSRVCPALSVCFESRCAGAGPFKRPGRQHLLEEQRRRKSMLPSLRQRRMIRRKHYKARPDSRQPASLAMQLPSGPFKGPASAGFPGRPAVPVAALFADIVCTRAGRNKKPRPSRSRLCLQSEGYKRRYISLFIDRSL